MTRVNRARYVVRRACLTLVTAGVSAILTAAHAAAQPYPGGGQTPPVVRGERFFPGRDGTARTGTDVLLLILIALLIVLLGLAFRAMTRRKAPRDT